MTRSVCCYCFLIFGWCSCVYSGMSVIWTSDIWTRRSTERPSNYCFLVTHTSCDVSCIRRRLYMCVFSRAWSLVVWLFQILLFCHHLFFICDPACAVVLRMLSVTPQKWKHCVLSIKLQTYGIFIVTDRVQSRHVQITDIPLYLTWHIALTP